MAKLDKRELDTIRAPICGLIAIDVPIMGMPGYSVTVSASEKVLGDKPYSEVERTLKNIVANLTLNL